jgi:multidrug efflux pump
MNISKLFILRPIATTLLMAAIILSGSIAYRQLPVAALPQVDYPTIQVVTFYPGAGPEVMVSSVTAPLEKQFGQIPGLSQMTSSSTQGCSVITLRFVLELDIDVAVQQVQASINVAANFLPRELPNPPIYSKVNPADAPVLTLSLSSSTIPLPKIQDLADTRLAQKLSQVKGVGQVSVTGGQKPAIRVQANPTSLSAMGLTLDDLRTALTAANVNQAKGSFDGPKQSIIIGANDQLFSAEQFRELIVAYRNNAPVKLSEVANVIDDVENVRQAAWRDTTPSVLLNIQRQPGANIIDVVDRIEAMLPQLKEALPADLQVDVLTDRTTTIRASVESVQHELLLTIGLVVLVIYSFLHSFRATIIPSAAVPLSIVGTFGIMYLMGYTLNNLTLMALTISTGFVVDDAIVMIENIMRYVEDGMDPLPASLKGASEIGFIDSTAVYGGCHRQAFPRICRDAQRDDFCIGNRLLDTHTDDVRTAAKNHPQARRQQSRSRHARLVIHRLAAVLRNDPEVDPQAPGLDHAGLSSHPCGYRFSLHSSPQRVLSHPGYRSDPRHHAERSRHIVCTDERQTSRTQRSSMRRSGRREHRKFHRYR